MSNWTLSEKLEACLADWCNERTNGLSTQTILRRTLDIPLACGYSAGGWLRVLAKFALDGIGRFQSDYGASEVTALGGAQAIDEHLTKAWKHVENLRLALENRTEEEIREILNDHIIPILELGQIASKVTGMEDVDWRISLLQDAMDEATHNLTRQLPCVFFDKLKLPGPIPISDSAKPLISLLSTQPLSYHD